MFNFFKYKKQEIIEENIYLEIIKPLLLDVIELYDNTWDRKRVRRILKTITEMAPNALEKDYMTQRRINDILEGNK